MSISRCRRLSSCLSRTMTDDSFSATDKLVCCKCNKSNSLNITITSIIVIARLNNTVITYSTSDKIYILLNSHLNYDWSMQVGTSANTIIITGELKTMHDNMMHLYDIHCKCFLYWHCHGKKKAQRTNGKMKVSMSAVQSVDRYCIIVLWMKKCCTILNIFIWNVQVKSSN